MVAVRSLYWCPLQGQGEEHSCYVELKRKEEEGGAVEELLGEVVAVEVLLLQVLEEVGAVLLPGEEEDEAGMSSM